MNTKENSSSGLAFTLRAFRSRNYRLYFSGQGISLIGTWMQNLAQMWLVYRLALAQHSANVPLLLGLCGFATQAPQVVLTPITGVLADRWNRYKMMIITQIGMMVITLAMAILFFAHLIHIWHIIVLGMCLGVLNAIDAPNRHAFVVHLVEDRSDLPGAIAMNSAMFNSARIIGPSIAGLVIQWTNEGVCFLANSLSFLAIILTLLAMRMPAYEPQKRNDSSIFHEFKEGFSYTFGSPPLRLVILHYAWVALTAMSFTTLMPIFSNEVLSGDSDSLGFLMGSLGIGAIVSALLMASRKKTTGLRRISGFSSSVFGISLILLSVSRSFYPSLAIMALAGFGMISQMTATNTFIQTTVEDDKRARVLAFYLLAFFGTVPLGSLMIGALAKILGTPMSIRLAGVSSICGSLVYLWFFSRLPKSPASSQGSKG